MKSIACQTLLRNTSETNSLLINAQRQTINFTSKKFLSGKSFIKTQIKGITRDLIYIHTDLWSYFDYNTFGFSLWNYFQTFCKFAIQQNGMHTCSFLFVPWWCSAFLSPLEWNCSWQLNSYSRECKILVIMANFMFLSQSLTIFGPNWLFFFIRN